MEMNRKLRFAVPLAAVLLVAACTNDGGIAPPSASDPLFAAGTPANGTGQCMGNDAFASGFTSGMGSATDLNCTSNDIDIAQAIVNEVSVDGGKTFTKFTGQAITCTEGQPIKVNMDAVLEQNANSARTDIGVWIATDGGTAITGTCNHYNLVNGTGGVTNEDGDSCGDMAKAATTQIALGVLDLTCQDTNNDGKMEVGSCLGWTQPGGDVVCPNGGSAAINFRFGTVPANKSKCNCEPFILPIQVARSAHIEVVKACATGTTGSGFKLKIDGTEYVSGAASTAGVSCGGTTGKITVPNGVSGASSNIAHTVAEVLPSGSWATPTWACVNRVGGASRTVTPATGVGPNTINLDANDDVICTVTNQGQGTIIIRKETVGGFGSFAFTRSFGGGFNLETVSGTNPVSTTFSNVAAGSHTVTETLPPAGWDFVEITGSGCSANNATRTVTIAVTAGSSTTCTFVNRKRATVTVNKRQDGGLPLSHAFTFEIRSGASSGVNGTTIATGSANTTTGVVTFNACVASSATCVLVGGVANIVPGNYNLCETGIPAGWSTTLNTFTTLDNARCTNFSVAAGASGSPAGIPDPIDNLSPPGGDPHTIGYWRNWSSCTKGNQYQKALEGGFEKWTLDQILPLIPSSPLTAGKDLGDIVNIASCEDAVNLLSKRNLSGTNSASDAAYSLAAQLLAGKLNYAAGATKCTAATTAMNAAQALLDEIGFDGTGTYLGSKSGDSRRADAIALAGTIGSYNEGTLCP